MDYKIILAENQVFETERLILRKIELSDAKDIFEYSSDEKTVKYIGFDVHKSIEDTEEAIVNYFIPNRLITWGIIDKENKKLIGTIDLRIKNKQASFGWIINKKYWGKGITFEAASCLKKFAFNSLEVEVISCIHDIDNPNSGRVMEKLEMNKLGHVWKYEKGENHLMAYWAITKNEYMDRSMTKI